MREKVRNRQYVMRVHAYTEMRKDGFSAVDVENGVLTGVIVERQKDADTGEWKYCLVGEAIDGRPIEVVVKIGPTGMVIILTVYIPEIEDNGPK